MNFTSPLFYTFLFLTVLAFHVSTGTAYRKTVLSIANLVMIASFSTAWTELLPLAAFLVLGYGLLRLVSRDRTILAMAASLLLILLLYVFLKQFFFLKAYTLPFAYTVIGLSYILFRMIHLIVDVSSGEIAVVPSPLEFFRYTCNFLCFVSGPIQTWQQFKGDEANLSAPLRSELVFPAFARVVTGLLKVAVVAATAHYLFENESVQIFLPDNAGRNIGFYGKYAFSAASYTAYLYYNFSGYMDIVLGAGSLLSQKLPENFDRPFTARSFLEFWQRWHITLSLWFKAYVFTPLMLFLVQLFPSSSATSYLGVLCFFVTFLLMGIWHGSTSVFVIYGFLMGLGASVNKLWQVGLTSSLGKKKYRLLQDSWAYSALSRGLTFAYFTTALTCLWVSSLDQLGLLSDRLGIVGITLALVALTLGYALLYSPFQFLQRSLNAIARLLRLRSVPAENLVLASRLLLVIFVMGLLNESPEFVYKAF
jgi:D-alanyl-lipoteichoic acid acyltransferase DltB (MBOAT superfamily)